RNPYIPKLQDVLIVHLSNSHISLLIAVLQTDEFQNYKMHLLNFPNRLILTLQDALIVVFRPGLIMGKPDPSISKIQNRINVFKIFFYPISKSGSNRFTCYGNGYTTSG